jgi:hypothetical protein
MTNLGLQVNTTERRITNPDVAANLEKFDLPTLL